MNFESIIILGFKRSGTSLLRVLLNSHPDIAIGPEIKFMQVATKKYPQTLEEFIRISQKDAGYFEYSSETIEKIYNTSKSTEDLFKNWCVEYMNKTGKKIWGDKTPQNFKYLKFLSEKFPDSLYVHIVRHPFDVMISSKKRKQYHGFHTIVAWFESNRRVKFVKDKNYMFMKYEDFVKDPNAAAALILEKLGVEKTDLVATYRNVDHGKIAQGDSWDKPIEKKERDEKVLSLKDRLMIRLICLPFFKKYGYK